MDISWLNDSGISTKDGIGYTGGEDRYLSAIQRFFKSYEENKKLIEDLLSSGDIEGYGIKVHSLKSNSKMIGASKLGEAFLELELAAKEKDAALIKEKTPAALKMYEEVIEVIRPIGEAEAIKAADEISKDEALKVADELLAALDDFDDELSSELASKLSGYPFRITQKQKLGEAIRYIEDFMYDEASDVIREIIPAIE